MIFWAQLQLYNLKFKVLIQRCLLTTYYPYYFKFRWDAFDGLLPPLRGLQHDLPEEGGPDQPLQDPPDLRPTQMPCLWKDFSQREGQGPARGQTQRTAAS